TLGAGLCMNRYLQAQPHHDHLLPVAADTDGDLLTDREEFALGYNPFDPDQNRNQILDGMELARRCAAAVAALPIRNWGEPEPETIYKEEIALDGQEQCDICGADIHMGGWVIINPRLQMKYPAPHDPLNCGLLPDLALHYMEHGSFSCAGSIHNGRVDIARLLRVLEMPLPKDDDEHQLPWNPDDFEIDPGTIGVDPADYYLDPNDLDHDLLTDYEELKAGFNLYDPDQDQNLTPDGIQLAKQCADIISRLPWYDRFSGDPPPKETYRWCDFQHGLETCALCGETVNMGPAGIVNPQLELAVDCPLIALHYMEHGSFSYCGNIHGGSRLNIPLLVQILQMPRRCGDLGTLYRSGDFNKDCIINLADYAELSKRWLTSTDPQKE
ncbi:MAG: hypothetical protein AMJ79_09485, partial [Phycisphaerae bacterium SM23_30]